MRTAAIACALLCACGGKISSAGWHPREEPAPADEPPAASFDEPADDAEPGVPPSSPPPEPAPPCAASFRRDVLPAFDRAGCTMTSCHGGPNPPSPPRIDGAAPRATYESLVAFRLSDGQPYRTAMACNLRGTCGVKMPLGGAIDPADLARIDAWLACGAPFN